MKTIETPTLNKMMNVQKQSEICGEFLEWLQSKYAMFRLLDSREEPVYVGSGDYINTEKLLAEFFEIDLDEAAKEKELLLQSIRG